jgi:gluconate 2-dehydrogenase gamma chain
MTDISRRTLLRVIAATPVASGLSTAQTAAQTEPHTHPPPERPVQTTKSSPYKPKFFTAQEYATVALLADLIIPADERSGGAGDAGVPEFIDFTMIDQPANQVAMRGGLAWLDMECQRRFDHTFLDCTGANRTVVLDDIAWPERAKPAYSQGVAFFSQLRSLVATGFWTSKMGIEDLQYQGNTFVAQWNGCPDDALRKIGVSPED